MTESEGLKIEMEAVEEIIERLCESLNCHLKKRLEIKGRLNRARRLEREELQNAERKS